MCVRDGTTLAGCRHAGSAALVGVSELGRLLADPALVAKAREMRLLSPLPAKAAMGTCLEGGEVAAALGAPRVLSQAIALTLQVR